MKKIVIFTTLLLIFPVFFATAADWKFLGGFTFSGEKMMTFYDAESLKYMPNGIVQVWSKSIRQSEVEKKLDNPEKDIIDKSADKIANGYSPPYPLSNIDNVDIIIWEVIANNSELQPYAKTLMEINCNENKMRTLTVTTFKDNGEIKGSKKLSREWDYISPESNGEILKKILCK